MFQGRLRTVGGVPRWFMAMLVAAAWGVAFLLAAALLWPAFAVAQAAADTTVDLGGLFGDARSAIEAGLGVVVFAIVGLIAFALKKYLGLSIDGKMRDALHSALTTGAHLGLDRIQSAADGAKLDVKSEAVANAVQYVRVSVPKAVKHFKLDEDRIADMLRAKLAERLQAAETKAAPAVDA